MELYEKADKGEQAEWSTAKKQLEKTRAELQDKLDEAAETIEGWKTQMRATGIRGYFRYAEGTVAGKLVRRMDWEMGSTGAHVPAGTDGNAGQDGEILIEEYSLSGDKEGNLIYTSIGKATKMTARMIEVAAKLSAPYYTDEESFEMKPGGGRSFSGNNGHSDKNSSLVLRAPEKPTATVVELPDWTDGKVQEMIDEYKRRCAEGMITEKAIERKTAMLKEIEEHQGQLIKELDIVHKENGEKKETLLLLSMWMKRKESWENTASNLAMGCEKEANPEGDPVNIDDWVNKFISFCTARLLPPSAASHILDEIQKLLDQALSTINRIVGERAEYLLDYPTEEEQQNVKVAASIKRFDDLLVSLNASYAESLKKQAIVVERDAEGNCFEEIEVDARFNGKGNTLQNETKVKPLLKNIARLMKNFPFLEITIYGDYAGPNDEIEVKEDSGAYKIDNYDPESPKSEDGVKKMSSDVAKLRALVLKKLLVNLKAPAKNIKTSVGKFSTKQRARIKVE